MGQNSAKWAVAVFLLAFALCAAAQEQPASSQSRKFESFRQRESYAMGVEMLRNLTRQGFEFDFDWLIRGMKDAEAGGNLALTDEELLEALNVSASEARVRKTSDELVAGQENKKSEQNFLEQNKSREGVVTLPSGLQYKVLKLGEGKRPVATDTVELNYRGTLVDGTEFENTYKQGQPARMKVADPHVIAGLREALKLMQPGSEWQVFIPSHLAYGQRGAGKIIGPYSMLIYDIELVAIR